MFVTSDIDDGLRTGGGIYAVAVDSDADGMTDAWESTFGLNPLGPTDATADLDGDGDTNLQEYQSRDAPNGRYARFLAEGSSNLAFWTQIAVLNPQSTPVAMTMRLPRPDGQEALSIARRIPAHTRITINPLFETERLFYGDFSTVVESDQPVVVDRTMRLLNDVGHGAHAETALEPAVDDLVLRGRRNRRAVLAVLSVREPRRRRCRRDGDLPASGAASPHRQDLHGVAARATYRVRRQEDPALAATNVSGEDHRELTRSPPSDRCTWPRWQPLGAATGGAGVIAPASRWFLAEGATGGFLR